jgi:hypothetical protein
VLWLPLRPRAFNKESHGLLQSQVWRQTGAKQKEVSDYRTSAHIRCALGRLLRPLGLENKRAGQADAARRETLYNSPQKHARLEVTCASSCLVYGGIHSFWLGTLIRPTIPALSTDPPHSMEIKQTVQGTVNRNADTVSRSRGTLWPADGLLYCLSIALCGCDCQT